MGKNKIVFNLTIKDLKELGIIKKKSKRRRRAKKNAININNIKSSSEHMLGPPSIFSNTSNLMTENLRLRNEELSNPTLRIKDEEDKIRMNKKMLEYENNAKLTNYMK
jgi:hypothetical protein